MDLRVIGQKLNTRRFKDNLWDYQTELNRDFRRTEIYGHHWLQSNNNLPLKINERLRKRSNAVAYFGCVSLISLSLSQWDAARSCHHHSCPALWKLSNISGGKYKKKFLSQNEAPNVISKHFQCRNNIFRHENVGKLLEFRCIFHKTLQSLISFFRGRKENVLWKDWLIRQMSVVN